MPKTQLLYQEDSYVNKTVCNLLKIVPDDRKTAYLVTDRSIFHPKSGGQPSDKGCILGKDAVFDVRRVMMAAGVVIHWGKCLKGVLEMEPVRQEIDWACRYEFMKRHTAAHLYDHCLSTVLGKRVETTDSWVGDDSYIGYLGNVPATERLREAQGIENAMIKAGAKVVSRLMSRDEAFAYAPEAPNLARLPSGTSLRVVTIDGCQGIPCGGTHIRDIAEIGVFHLDEPEDLGDRFRIRFHLA